MAKYRRLKEYKTVEGYEIPVGVKAWKQDEFLNKFIEKNRARIMEVAAANRNSKGALPYNEEQLKVRIKRDVIGKKYSTVRAATIARIKHGLEFTKKGEILGRNVIEGLYNKHRGEYDKFIEAITKPDGTYKIDITKMRYDGNGVYVYDERVEIHIKDSPMEVYIVKLENDEYEPTQV